MERVTEWDLNAMKRQFADSTDGITVPRPALEQLVEAGDFAITMIEHAIALGHLGDGSTLGMAKHAIKKLRDAGCVNPGD